jgi:hypothetical protein
MLYTVSQYHERLLPASAAIVDAQSQRWQQQRRSCERAAAASPPTPSPQQQQQRRQQGRNAGGTGVRTYSHARASTRFIGTRASIVFVVVVIVIIVFCIAAAASRSIYGSCVSSGSKSKHRRYHHIAA